MMKNLKRMLVLLLAVMLLFTLCGCDALDEMRERQAFVNEDGTITWQGNTYKELPYNEFLSVDGTYDNRVFATERDVPVLLSDSMFEKIFYATDDKRFLTSSYGEVFHYCIESSYDEMCARIWAPFEPEIVCYHYSFYNKEANEYQQDTYTLTQEQLDAIKLIIETEKPTELADGMYLDTMNDLILQECSADMLFGRDAMRLSVSGSGKTYYLTLYTATEDVLFTVPAGCNAIFDDIYKAYNEANGIMDKEYPAEI